MGPEATVAPLAGDDPVPYVTLLYALAIGAGLVGLLGWLLRLGWLTVFLSRSILLGYILESASSSPRGRSATWSVPADEQRRRTAAHVTHKHPTCSGGCATTSGSICTSHRPRRRE